MLRALANDLWAIRNKDKRKQAAVRVLEDMGYAVTLEPITSAQKYERAHNKAREKDRQKQKLRVVRDHGETFRT